MELPLSWIHSPISEIKINSLPLKQSAFTWLTMGDIPLELTFAQIIKQLPREKYVIRGCTPPVAAVLARHGWQCIQSGVEATLNLKQSPNWSRKMKHGIRRGRQALQFTELPLNVNTIKRLKELATRTPFAFSPQLQHVFRFTDSSALRLFVARDNREQWQAAFTISLNAPGRFQGELMLRNVRAPYGAMEALIAYVCHRLKKENIALLSLGEVPFMLQEAKNLKEKMIKWGGVTLLPAYDFRGLYFFKNKFKPVWRPVFLCATPAINLGLMVDLLKVSGTLSLWRYGIRKTAGAVLPGLKMHLQSAAALIPAMFDVWVK